MKRQRGVRVYLFSFSNLGARWRCVVNVTLRPPFPPIKEYTGLIKAFFTFKMHYSSTIHAKCNFIYDHTKSTALLRPIFTKPINVQQRYISTSFRISLKSGSNWEKYRYKCTYAHKHNLAFTEPIFTKLPNVQQRHVKTSHRILPKSDNNWGKCRYKFIYAHK